MEHWPELKKFLMNLLLAFWKSLDYRCISHWIKFSFLGLQGFQRLIGIPASSTKAGSLVKKAVNL